MLKVFNVKQGDSFCLYRPNELPLVIDCGYKNAKIFEKLISRKITDIDVLLTHSDADHRNGLIDILKESSIKVNKLYLPYYFNEIINIMNYIHKQKVTLNIANVNKILLKDGDIICSNSAVYNPQSNIKDFFEFENLDKCYNDILPTNEDALISALERLNELGLDLPIKEIIDYKSDLNIENESYKDNSTKFIHTFFILLNNHVNSSTSKYKLKNIYKYIRLTANQASIVFRYFDKYNSILFTGDADKKVFYRMIKENKILKSNILKVPHHGSKYNLDGSILDYIQPKIAIISHDNKNKHPSIDVINYLKEKKRCITSYYTNKVNNDTTIKQAKGYHCCKYIEFIQ